jgi:hypothetical protein
MNLAVATFLRSDCPRGAYIVRLAGNGVVFAFSMRNSDRMDGRKIDDVESHLFRILDAREAIPKGGMFAFNSPRRTRKKFIPRRKGRELGLDDELDWLGESGGNRAIRPTGDKCDYIRISHQGGDVV